jgi:hypothetical protein
MLKTKAFEAREITERIRRKNSADKLAAKRKAEARIKEKLSRQRRVIAIYKQILSKCEALALNGETCMPFNEKWNDCKDYLAKEGFKITEPPRPPNKEIVDELKSLSTTLNQLALRFKPIKKQIDAYEKKLHSLIDESAEKLCSTYTPPKREADSTRSELLRLETKRLSAIDEKLSKELGNDPIRNKIKSFFSSLSPTVDLFSEYDELEREIFDLRVRITFTRHKLDTPPPQLLKIDWSALNPNSNDQIKLLNWLSTYAQDVFSSVSELIDCELSKRSPKREIWFSSTKGRLKVGSRSFTLPKYVSVENLLEKINSEDGYGYDIYIPDENDISRMRIHW